VPTNGKYNQRERDAVGQELTKSHRGTISWPLTQSSTFGHLNAEDDAACTVDSRPAIWIFMKSLIPSSICPTASAAVRQAPSSCHQTFARWRRRASSAGAGRKIQSDQNPDIGEGITESLPTGGADRRPTA